MNKTIGKEKPKKSELVETKQPKTKPVEVEKILETKIAKIEKPKEAPKIEKPKETPKIEKQKEIPKVDKITKP